MNRDIKMCSYFLVIILCFCQVVGAQDKTPGGVSGAVLWLVPTPVSSDLQGMYCWKNCINQELEQYLQDDDVVKIQGGSIWQVPREQIRCNNYQPLLPLGQDNLSKKISIRDTPLNQMTSFAVFTTTQHRSDLSKILYQIERDFNPFAATKSSIMYFSAERNSLTLSPEVLSSIKEQDNLLYLLTHSVADPPFAPSVWGQDNIFKVFWGAVDASGSPHNSMVKPSQYAQELYCSEFIIYPRWLSPTERLQVESYLAIKHGLQINKSYVLGKQMLWERDSDYHYRVSGFARIPSSGLSTRKSTTRRDVPPIWLNDKELHRDIDSFFEGNSYNRSSEFSLLSISEEDASSRDSCYFVYGDNNGSLEISEQEENTRQKSYRGFRFIQRRWKAFYHFPKSTEQSQNLWSGNLEIRAGANHLYSFATESESNPSSRGVVRTTQPLKKNEGYYAFTYREGEFKIGYEVDSELYAYQIDVLGRIYIITKGVRSREIDHILHQGDKVEILRNSDRMYLRVNGRSVPSSHATGLPRSQGKYLGFLEMSSPLNNVRVGGFYDEGCKVELSSSLFPNISDSNLSRIYLVIDPQGRGDFDHKDLVFIPASSWDKERKQVIFNNVHWGDKEQGKVYFSFGYRDADFILYSKSTGCRLSLKISGSERAEALYRYGVKDLKRDEIIASGIMVANKEALIPIYNSSEYEVNVEEFTFLNAGWKSFKMASESPKASGLISWTHQSGDYASIIFRDRNKQVFPSGANFRMHSPGAGARGIQISQDNLVGIYDFPVYESGHKLSDGDQITIELHDDGMITYWVNNESIWGFPLSRAPQFGSDTNFEVLFFRQSENNVKNLLIKGLHPWEGDYLSGKEIRTLSGVLMQTYTTSIKERLHIDCDDLRSIPSIKGNEPRSKDLLINELAESLNPFRVYQESQLYHHRAVLTLQKEVTVDLLVFDMAGHLVYEASMSHHGGEYIKSFEIHTPGVYVVKALTNEAEYTQKIQVR